MAPAISYQTEEELIKTSLYPYIELNKQGLINGIMTGHVRMDNIDKGMPASLSRKVIDIIKNQGFDGFFVTDGLRMMSVMSEFGDIDPKGMCIEAGNTVALDWEYTKRAYRKMIAQTDELVKTQFIEMFGDPQDNPKGWHVCTLNDVMKASASNGFFAKPKDYCEDGNAGIICVGDVVNRKYSNISSLRRANASEKEFAKYHVEYGDMLFCRSSLVKEGIAKASIVPKTEATDLLFECHVIRIPLDMEMVIPEFMQAYSTTDYFRQQMMDKSKTATMTTIGQKDVITGIIYVPPLELQMEFVNFAEQSDKSKFELQKALDEMTAMQKKIIEQNLT
jgi:type I restriction enzyme S subunit